MKKLLTILCLLIFLLVGCGSSKEINGQTCKPYGLINKENVRCDCVKYDYIFGNIVWGIILIETIIAPIYFFGFSLWEPIGLDQNCSINDTQVKNGI